MVHIKIYRCKRCEMGREFQCAMMFILYNYTISADLQSSRVAVHHMQLK